MDWRGKKITTTRSKYILIVLFVLCSFFSLTQGQVDRDYQKDTIRYDHYTGGKLDSIDISFAKLSSTLPGGASSTSPIPYDYDFLFRHEGGGVMRPNFEWRTMRFSALPHLGFGAIFGNQATQIIHATYTHAFIDNTLLNIDYDKRQGNAFMRSSEFAHHDLCMQIERKSKFYSFQLQTNYLTKKMGHNAGVLSEDLLDGVPLAFVPTKKTDATSKYQMGNVRLEHFFHLLTRDTLRSTGFVVENQFNVVNRKYREVDNNLSQIYSFVLISPDSTNDQFQVANYIHSLSLYHQRQKLYLQIGTQYNDWHYDNLGVSERQSEVNIDIKGILKTHNFFLTHCMNGNLYGAKGSWSSSTKIKTSLNGWRLEVNSQISSLLPQIYQRSYHGNNIIYNTPFEALKRQFRANIQAQIDYQYKQQSIGVFANMAQFNNNYWFYNDHWSPDTLKNIHALSLGIVSKIHVNILHFSFSAAYNLARWMPNYLLQSRLFLQGKMFKERKMTAQIGVEASYHTAYVMFSVLPIMDVYRLTNISTSGRGNVHMFGAFEIQRFRFFLRFENIGYTWTDHKQQVALGYPIAPMQLRVGITWDFFN